MKRCVRIDIASASPEHAPALCVRRYREDDSVFFDHDYVIKGAAGRILWSLVSQFALEERTEFCNRELRLDKSLNLSPFKDNLEARLSALRQRLRARGGEITLVTIGRGKFRLSTTRLLVLEEIGVSAGASTSQI